MNDNGTAAAESRARRFEKSAEASREAIRIFPDYVGSVIWYDMFGPVPYEDTHLSPALIADMEEWEANYYSSLTDHYSFRSKRAEREHITRGLDIARALSEQIGDVLPVDADEIGGGKTRFSTPGAGTNPLARASFLAMRTHAEAEDARHAAALRHGARFEWRPSSGPTD